MMETMVTDAFLPQIFFNDMTIPAWQMALFIVIISVFMLLRRHKLCLVTTYLFTFYWAFFLYWGEVVLSSFGELPYAAVLYLVFGTIHIVLTLIGLFQEEA